VNPKLDVDFILPSVGIIGATETNNKDWSGYID